MKEHLHRRSIAAGYRNSILPEFTVSESEFIKGTVDFFGVNIYSSLVVTTLNQSTNSLSWGDAMEVRKYQPNTWEETAQILFKVISNIQEIRRLSYRIKIK